jgi:hypothetical protein
VFPISPSHAYSRPGGREEFENLNCLPALLTDMKIPIFRTKYVKICSKNAGKHISEVLFSKFSRLRSISPMGRRSHLQIIYSPHPIVIWFIIIAAKYSN